MIEATIGKGIRVSSLSVKTVGNNPLPRDCSNLEWIAVNSSAIPARNSLPVGESSTIRGWPPPGRRARGAEGLGVAVARPLRNRWIPAWRQNNQMCQQCRESTGFLIELHGRGQIYKVLPAASPFFCQLSRAAAVCRGRARAPLFNLASRESLETPFFDSK